MANNDLTNALLKAQGIQEFMGGGEATHTMPDGTVMPGATHAEYEAMGYQEGGVPMMPMAMPEEQMQPMDPAMELESAIEGLQIQKMQANDPDEIKALDRMIEAAMVGASAPLGAMAAEIQAQGRGEDTSLAHLRPGEVILPPEAFEDEQFERTVNAKFEELGIDPEMAVSSVGIASLNPMTGLEEFGFFKKLAKGVKKVVKKVIRPIAKVAQFIPGPWQPIAALVNKAGTVYDVAKGRANPLSLLTVAGPLRTGPSIGDSISAIKGAGTSGTFLGGLGQSFKDMPSALSKGVGSLVNDPLGTAKGLFKSQNPDDYAQDAQGNYFNKITGEVGLPTGITDPSQMLSRSGSGIQGITKNFQSALFGGAQVPGMPNVPGAVPPAGGVPGAGSQYQIQSGDTLSQIAQQNGMTVDQLLDANEHIKDRDMIFAGQTLNIPGMATAQGGNFLSNIFSGGGRDNVGNFGMIGDIAGGFTDRLGLTNYGLGGQQQGGGGGMFGGMGGIGGLAAAGIPAYLLGKMAYDEAKKDRGVPLTPLTTMGPTGRYNIEAEIAKRMGTQAPNPVEFGLLPSGTIPTLSGGQPMQAAMGGAVYPMAYAEGGNVAMEDFERMNGQIDGPGTETSDDIPAMLSDGEFVMTGAAVRGAGGFEMQNQGGILTLTPTGTPDRERGTNMMYEMMDLFGSYANANA
jgi:murein DD-endopeptidase MepM/ murein hydrolase activator NlpD